MDSDLINRQELVYDINNNKRNKELRECEAIVFSLFKTAYDIIQITVLLDDINLAKKIYNASKNIIELIRGYWSLILIDKDSNEILKNYAQYEYNQIENIYKLNSLNIMPDTLLPRFYSWVYEGGEDFFDLSNAYKLFIENDSLVIQNFRTITNISQIIKNTKRLL